MFSVLSTSIDQAMIPYQSGMIGYRLIGTDGTLDFENDRVLPLVGWHCGTAVHDEERC